MNNANPIQVGKIKEAAIIVASPFQALCAMEAIEHFSIEMPVFYAYESKNSLKKTHDFIVSKGYQCEDLEDVSGIFSIINTFKSHKKFDFILSGDFFSKYCFLICFLWSKFNSKIIYLDDGNSTLTLLPPISKKRFHDGKFYHIIIYRLLFILTKLKGIKLCFYTIYDVEGKGFPYLSLKNSFSSLLLSDYSEKAGVYIIGTISCEAGIDKQRYCKYLKYIKEFSDNHFPEESVYYCPHRSDQNHYDRECEEIGVEVFNTKVSVEVDFVVNNFNPVAVFGFGSTALLTLKKIYPESKFFDIIYRRADKQLDEEYKQIETIYKENGVSLLNIDL